jgi:hypothetical protein
MKVKELLSDPATWVKGAFALKANGDPTYEFDPEARHFCLIGAMIRCYRDDVEYDVAYRKLRDAIPGNSIYRFNDNFATTHEQIMEVLTKADV